MTSSIRQTNSNGQPADVRTASNIVATLWRTLSQPSLLLVLGALALLLILGGLMLPQLPGQLNDEPAAAARWLLTTSGDYGPVGPLLRNLGMFHVLHSPALRLLLALIGLILCIQFADALGTILSFTTVQSAYTEPQPLSDEPEPLPIPPYQRIYRRWFTHPNPPPTYARQTEKTLHSRFQQVQRHAVPLPAAAAQTGVAAQNGTGPTPGAETANDQQPDPPGPSPPPPADPLQEERLLARHNERIVYLRPLLPLGLLIALVSVWLIVVLGWQIATPTLVPGERFRSVRQDFTLSYDAVIHGQDVEPVIEIGYNGQVISTTLSSTTSSISTQPVHLQIDTINVQLRSGDPALLLHSATNDTIFALPGQSRTSSTTGLSFPAPGSEETVILPAQSAGLRIVRKSGTEEGFLVELYEGDQVEPVERLDIEPGENQSLSVGEDQLAVEFIPIPGIQAEIRHLPAPWLLWIAGLIALLGIIGALSDASFLLIQVRPWGKEHALIIAQTNSPKNLDMLQYDHNPGKDQETGTPEGPEPAHRDEDALANDHNANSQHENEMAEADAGGELEPDG